MLVHRSRQGNIRCTVIGSYDNEKNVYCGRQGLIHMNRVCQPDLDADRVIDRTMAFRFVSSIPTLLSIKKHKP